MSKLRSAAVGLLVSAVAGACSINLNAERYVGKEEKTFTVTGKPEVFLKTFDGSIQVTTWDKPQVGVVIERYAGSQVEADELKVTATQDGNRISVEAVQPQEVVQVGFNHGRSVRFIVSVPKETDLLARTGDGSISTTGVKGRVELRSGDGSVHGVNLTGDIAVHTGDGSIALENVNGRVDVNTGDGSVRVQGVPTALKAHTGDGSVAVDVASGASISEDWEITTGDGGVRLALPPTVGAELDARTGDGGIAAGDFGLETNPDTRNELRGRIGSGGRLLKVRTGDGSITVAKN